MSQKRAAEDEVAIQRCTRIKLASPSPVKSSGSDTESIRSCQGYETEFVKDTSDTSSSPVYNIEYEVTDLEEKKEQFYEDSDDDSETQFVVALNHDIGSLSQDSFDLALLGDSSEENSTSPTSNSDVDPGLPRSDYLDFEKCLLCQTDQKDVSYPYCSSCFTWKKNLFPSRPKKKHKIGKKEKTFNSNINSDTISVRESNEGDQKECNSVQSDNLGQENSLSQGYFEDSGVASSEPQLSEDVVDGPVKRPSTPTEPSTSNSKKLTLDMCRVCFAKPENGLFIHLNIAHLYGCYSCAKKIWCHNGGCPICRRKIFKVARLYV